MCLLEARLSTTSILDTVTIIFINPTHSNTSADLVDTLYSPLFVYLSILPHRQPRGFLDPKPIDMHVGSLASGLALRADGLKPRVLGFGLGTWAEGSGLMLQPSRAHTTACKPHALSRNSRALNSNSDPQNPKLCRGF